MKTGVVCAATAYTADIMTLAGHAEALGFESLWMIDHPVIPENHQTPYPMGGPLPDHYYHILEPLVALAAAAGATSTLRLGTNIILIPEREPLVAAKEIATLDQIAGGRFELGIGAGWLKEEGEVMGTHWPRRWAQTREYIQAMKTCWTEEIAGFHGEYVNFPPLYSDPKPLQKPYPPILIAGELAKSSDRVVDYGDGWLPRYANVGAAVLQTVRRDIENRLREAGRDTSRFQITLFGCPPEQEARRRMQDAGVDRVLHVMPVLPEQQGLEQLSRWADELFEH